jgi:hypothetical protein
MSVQNYLEIKQVTIIIEPLRNIYRHPENTEERGLAKIAPKNLAVYMYVELHMHIHAYEIEYIDTYHIDTSDGLIFNNVVIKSYQEKTILIIIKGQRHIEEN